MADPSAPLAHTYHYIRPPGRVFTFTADLISAGERMIVMELPLDREEPLLYRGEVVLAAGYRAVWFLVKGQGWDIAAVYRPGGGLTGYYVDVLDPVHWQADDPATLLPIVDLFLDVWVTPGGDHEVLDNDEFEEAVAKHWISGGQRDHARRVLAEIEGGIRAGTFPPPEVREIAEKTDL